MDNSFDTAVKHIQKQSKLRLTNEQKLKLYGLYKQATIGKCDIKQPSIFDFAGSAKWKSWKSFGDMAKEEAEKKYIQLVEEFDPGYQTRCLQEEYDWSSSISSSSSSSSSLSMGPRMSRMKPSYNETSKDWEEIEDIYYDVRKGNIQAMEEWIQDKTRFDQVDEEGRNILHWAVDIGHVEMVQKLLAVNYPIHKQDVDGMTALHYAVNCEYKEIIQLLIQAGADIHVKDQDGDSPLSIAKTNASYLLVLFE